MSSGVSMHVMTRNVPPRTPPYSMSMWKTPLSRCIQLARPPGALTGRRESTRRLVRTQTLRSVPGIELLVHLRQELTLLFYHSREAVNRLLATSLA